MADIYRKNVAATNRINGARNFFQLRSAWHWLVMNMPEVATAIREKSYEKFPVPSGMNRTIKNGAYNYLKDIKPSYNYVKNIKTRKVGKNG